MGPDGDICIRAAVPTDVIVDLQGVARLRGVSSLQRLVDTRTGGVTVDGLFAAVGPLTARTDFSFQATGRAGIGSDLLALNVTAVDAVSDGHLVVRSCSDSTETSNVNFRPSTARAGLVLVRPDANGRVCVRAAVGTHLIVDYVGSFAAS